MYLHVFILGLPGPDCDQPPCLWAWWSEVTAHPHLSINLTYAHTPRASVELIDQEADLTVVPRRNLHPSIVTLRANAQVVLLESVLGDMPPEAESRPIRSLNLGGVITPREIESFVWLIRLERVSFSPVLSSVLPEFPEVIDV